jgi:hypothetical protein
MKVICRYMRKPNEKHIYIWAKEQKHLPEGLIECDEKGVPLAIPCDVAPESNVEEADEIITGEQEQPQATVVTPTAIVMPKPIIQTEIDLAGKNVMALKKILVKDMGYDLTNDKNAPERLSVKWLIAKIESLK